MSWQTVNRKHFKFSIKTERLKGYLSNPQHFTTNNLKHSFLRNNVQSLASSSTTHINLGVVIFSTIYFSSQKNNIFSVCVSFVFLLKSGLNMVIVENYFSHNKVQSGCGSIGVRLIERDQSQRYRRYCR